MGAVAGHEVFFVGQGCDDVTEGTVLSSFYTSGLKQDSTKDSRLVGKISTSLVTLQDLDRVDRVTLLCAN